MLSIYSYAHYIEPCGFIKRHTFTAVNADTDLHTVIWLC